MFKKTYYTSAVVLFSGVSFLIGGCQHPSSANQPETKSAAGTDTVAAQKFLTKPLVTDMYTADPAAHVFEGKIYLYPSHDIDTGIAEKDDGAHFDMRDYHVFSMDSVNGPIQDHGIALDIKDIPWAGRQLWAPDAAYKNGKYYLYFPMKDKEDIFRIGVASSTSPAGPFKPEPKPIANSFSTDPAVFTDTDGVSYMYFGGIWGGQLQRWSSGRYNPKDAYPKDDQPALMPKVARMSQDMLGFEGEVKEVQLLDGNGKPLLNGDNQRRFFEAAWVHKYKGKYYFSYSTGDTHNIAYAIGDSPMGPFTYKGVLLNPVQGWTNHHAVVEHKGKWHLFYHDTELSGKTHLRNMKVTGLSHRADGTIETITAYKQ
jgi:beta-xylosidase